MKRVLAGIAISFVVATSIFAQGQKPAAAANDPLAEARAAIEKGNAQWVEGWAKGDAAMVAAIFAEDGVLLTRNGKVHKGPRQIAELQKAAMQSADPGVKVTVTTINVWLDGDTAYETGKYKYEYKENGKPGTDEGKYVTAWRRQKDGAWKLVMDVGVPQE